jgi:hypothetical protein
MTVHVGFAVGKVTLEQVSVQSFGFSRRAFTAVPCFLIYHLGAGHRVPL